MGGRIASTQFGSRKVELGAQWLSSASSNPVAALATQYSAPRALSSSDLDSSIGVKDPTAQSLGLLDTAGQADVSLGGLAAIPQGLATELNKTTGNKVLLNSTVATIAYDDLNATVVLANGTSYRSQFVVCTAPLGVLQLGGIQFVPPIPDDTYNAMMNLTVVTGDVVHLLFDAPFWPAGSESLTLSGAAAAAGWTNFLSMFTFTGQPLLVALPSAERSAIIDTQTDADVVASVMSALRSSYGDAVPVAPLASMVTRWRSNPYARGSYSFYGTDGSPADRSTLAEPVGGTLLFAGEATHAVYPSTVHGAYMSGLDQATRIANTMDFPDPGQDQNATCLADCYGPADVPVPSE